MSLISSPRHIVQVIPVEEVIDDSGAVNLVEKEPVDFACNVRPLSASELDSYGSKLTDSYSITAPPGAWVWDSNSVVIYDGERFEQVGRVRKSRRGRSTQADRVIIQRGQSGG